MNGPKPKTLKAKIIAFLKASPGKRFKARQIAKGITRLYPEDFEKKRGGFATETLFLNQIVAEIGSQHKDIMKSGNSQRRKASGPACITTPSPRKRLNPGRGVRYRIPVR